MSNSQLNKLKSGIKNGTQKMVNELLLTNTQVSKFCKTFENGSLTNIKLSKYQLHKIGHQEDF